MKFLRLLLIFAFCCAFWRDTLAQQVTVLNKYPGNETVDTESYVLKNVQQHTIIINEYEQVSHNQGNRLQEMIGFSIRSYIDRNFFISNSKIQALKSANEAMTDLTAIVRNAIWIMDFEFDQEFQGFSGRLNKLLTDLRELNGRDISPALSAAEIPKAGLVPQYAFQKAVYETKIQVEAEVEAFLKGYASEIEGDLSVEIVEPKQNPEPKQAYLEPLDFELEPISENKNELAALKPEVVIGGIKDKEPAHTEAKPETAQSNTPETISEQQAFFNSKIIELLEDNNKILASYNDRFASMQDQIDQIKNEQLQTQKQENREIRQELAELREMVMTVISGREYAEKDGSHTRKMELEPVRLVFQKNEYELSYQQKVLLNQVKEGLLKNRDYRVLITGYADKSGDRDFNNWISRQRALEVKKYLAGSGIDNERLVVNYFGETRSTAPNPDDRRVEVEWLVNFTAQNSTP